MKKLLALVLTLAMIAALAAPAMALNITVPKVTIPLDGNFNDGYAGPWDIKYFNDAPGATGQFWAAWDDDYIYYYVKVDDATPNHEHGNHYERDNVEFFFDWYNAKDDDTGDDTHPYWQIRIASQPAKDSPTDMQPGGEVLSINENWAALGWDQPEDKLAALLTSYVVNFGPTQYSIQLRVPYKQFGLKVQEGSVIGTDLMIGDNQEDAGRTSMAFPDPDFVSNNQYQHPFELGVNMTLGAAPPPPPPPEEEAPAAAGGGEAAPEPPPVPARPAPATGDAGIAALAALIAAAAMGMVVLKKRQTK